MARPLRVQYEGAIYHLMNRGDRRQMIFHDDEDRRTFLALLERVCLKTGWQVHAYVLMGNHFHLVVETPQPNLCVGMKWFLGAYTQAFNRRHRLWGHLFGGRYKAQHIDERDPSYLVMACDYVHLNPARAGLVEAEERIEVYPWSSYPAYLQTEKRRAWLRCDRLLGEHSVEVDEARGRREFARRTESQRARPGEEGTPLASLGRSGWRIGAEDFADWLSDRLRRRGRKTEKASERCETNARLAERLVREGLAARGWTEANLQRSAKTDAVKINLARLVRSQTPMTLAWTATRLRIGSASYLAALLTKGG